ncbi:MAG TPA: DegT/DnrJ/EryC1/StrS family aminotransferase [Terriglobia bacterium]|nr:DegT/DnrJ/EryC1/StrS family aminotransferase [Terriglobia bacterium]
MMKVPQLDLKRQHAALAVEIGEELERVLDSGAFILGDEVAKFELEFAAYVEAKHCVAVNSGTSALHLALLAAGVGPGDEVITTANTFIATAEAISYTGARPVFADIDRATANIDPNSIEQALTARTRAILPVHLYGRPADMDPILEIARSLRSSSGEGVAVIEDAAQAHGARYRGRRVGALGIAGAFSFYPTKNLSACGEGGALVTNDDKLAERARALRSHGESRRYFHDCVGYNYRMEAFQGAVLRVKLRHLPEWTRRRQEIAQLYRSLLAAAPVETPLDDPTDECVYHQFAVYLSGRDQVRAAMESGGVATGIYYPLPIHLQPACAGLGYQTGSLPATERACARVLCLPMFPEMTDAEVKYVAATLKQQVAATGK